MNGQIALDVVASRKTDVAARNLARQQASAAKAQLRAAGDSTPTQPPNQPSAAMTCTGTGATPSGSRSSSRSATPTRTSPSRGPSRSLRGAVVPDSPSRAPFGVSSAAPSYNANEENENEDFSLILVSNTRTHAHTTSDSSNSTNGSNPSLSQPLHSCMHSLASLCVCSLALGLCCVVLLCCVVYFSWTVRCPCWTVSSALVACARLAVRLRSWR